MDQAYRWVIKYFFAYWQCCVEWSTPTWIAQSSQQQFVGGVIICQLVYRLAVDILNISLVTHCPYADLLTNLTQKCTN